MLCKCSGNVLIGFEGLEGNGEAYPGWIMRTTSDNGRVVRGENLCFLCLCVCVCVLFRRGWSEVLIKYTGKYVKTYFIIKIT